MTIATEMWSDDSTRRAETFLQNGVWHVNLFEKEQLVECRAMMTDGVAHSEHYAESCAENWCLGVF